MGWLSIGGSKQSSSSNQTQTTTPEIPAWVQQNVQGAVDRAQQISQRPFTPYGGELAPGLNGFDARAEGAATATAGAWQPYTAAAAGATGAGLFAPVRDVRAGPGVRAATGAQGMGQYADPWQTQVTDAALSAIRRTGDKAQAQLGQNLAAQGAFGGSREAILRGEIERGVQENSASTAANIGSEGFRTAAGLGQQDADRRSQVSMFNSGQRLDAQRANQGQDAASADRSLAGASLFNTIAGTQGAQGRADVSMFAGLGDQTRGVQQGQDEAAYNEWMRGQNSDIDNYRLLLEGVYGAPFNLFSGSTTSASGSSKGGGFSFGLGGK